MTSETTRRELLRRMSALTCCGAAASTFGLQLASMGEASAQAGAGFQALVCIFLFGGNDANNMVLATDADSWARYNAARNTGTDPIGLLPPGTPPTALGAVNPVSGRVPSNYTIPEAWGGVLPIASAIPNPVPAGTNSAGRTFALNPHLAHLLPVWTGGRLATVANVGPLIQSTTKAQYRAASVPLPANLMSHNDQQSTWQSGSAEGSRRGWGGLAADQFLAGNGANSVFTAMSTSGNTVFLAGANVVQYQMSTNQSSPAIRVNAGFNNTTTVFGGANASATIREIIRNTNGTSAFMKDFGAKVTRSQDSADLLNTQFATGGPGFTVAAPSQMLNPITRGIETNPLAVQLQSVAKVIASNAALGTKKQVFFVSMGGFDTHGGQNILQSVLMARLGHAMAYFDGALGNINGVNYRNAVTTFTASDFSRTFTSNGDGTDHAWGSHQFVMGGAVKGGSVYGQFPTVGIDQGSFANPNMDGNVMVPTTSVDQFAGTMGKWFGLSDTQLDAIFPNLKNFGSSRYLGFL